MRPRSCRGPISRPANGSGSSPNWPGGTTPTTLGRLPGFTDCYALAVSSDGGRIVGNCANLGMQQSHIAGFVWDKKHGLRSIADALAKAGVAVPDATLLEAADSALYRAKNNGRDRVEVGVDLDPRPRSPSSSPDPRPLR